jgi:hypothetical protein
MDAPQIASASATAVQAIRRLRVDTPVNHRRQHATVAATTEICPVASTAGRSFHDLRGSTVASEGRGPLEEGIRRAELSDHIGIQANRLLREPGLLTPHERRFWLDKISINATHEP